MRIFRLGGNDIQPVDTLESLGNPTPGGFAWVSCTREELQAHLSAIQATLQQWGGAQMVDLHVSDLLNRQLPSHYDYTAQYDVLVFRRLAASHGSPSATLAAAPRSGPPILRRIDTSPVGFVVMENVLLSVHPGDCTVRDIYADKLMQSSSADARAAGSRIPTSPPDLMLRIINTMVDGFLELRRELNHQLDHWQVELLNPRTRFNNWGALLDARLSLHQLDEVCEDQRAAVQDWIEAVKTWPEAETPAQSRERDLLQVRGRDVLEHIERVVHHVRRLEQSMETAVQMHFSAQGNRTNDIMRTLTALTAVFLPLNLIAGIFGMNFDAIPLLHSASGFWWAVGSMSLIATILIGLFWRKRYIARTER
jgi:Mg2+ and Co2+ transporter CorA